MTDNILSKKIGLYPHFLWFLILFFSMTLAIANWYDVRLINIFGMVTTPGAIIFPITFVLSNSITEVYGFKFARLAIRIAFIFNLLFLCFGQIVIHIPSPSFNLEQAKAFDNIMALNARIVVGSCAGYILSEPINSYIVAKLKILFKGNYMAIRFVLSTITAAAVDSCIFIFTAFYGEHTFAHCLTLVLNIWLIKSFVELAVLPLSIRITKRLKEIEKLDIYDYDTNFNPLLLDMQYPISNNHYKSR